MHHHPPKPLRVRGSINPRRF